MDKRTEYLSSVISDSAHAMKEMALTLWLHPQSGFREWEAHRLLSDAFRKLGYSLVEASGIPGFYTDIILPAPGPSICVIAELDALPLESHPEAVDGYVHACGHHIQGACLLGLAAALKDTAVTAPLCGKIRLMAVPAEETVELPFRSSLVSEGIIEYTSGKTEFIRRGCFDGIDLALMMHLDSNPSHDLSLMESATGMLTKTFTYIGKSAHAGGCPQDGINAQYAAAAGLQAINNIRETFTEKDYVRVHPILHGASCAVNIIPDRITGETFVRGASFEAIKKANFRVNRALAGAAVSMGASLHIEDRYGAMPEHDDTGLIELAIDCFRDIVPYGRIDTNYRYTDTGSSDFGDVTALMPGLQFYVHGATGSIHGTDFRVPDPEATCSRGALCELLLIDALLKSGGEKAAGIIDAYTPVFSSKEELIKAINLVYCNRDIVSYDEEGKVIMDL